MLLKDMSAQQMAKYFAVGGPGVPKVYMCASDFADGIPLPVLINSVGLTSTRGEARRLMEQGGVYVEEVRVRDIHKHITTDSFVDDLLLLRVGKYRCKRIVLR